MVVTVMATVMVTASDGHDGGGLHHCIFIFL